MLVSPEREDWLKRALTSHPRLHRMARRAQKVSRYYARRPHEPEFRAFQRWSDSGLFLDVGANVGQSAMSFRLYNKRSPILSLEPNPAVEPELAFLKRRVLRRGFDYYMIGAGALDEMIELYVPMVDAVEVSGEASFEKDHASERWDGTPMTVRAVWVPVMPIDSLNLSRVSYMKIDVEGAQSDVITGALDTIERDRPVIMSEGPLDVVSMLSPFGYRAWRYDPDVDEMVDFPPHGGPETGFLLPA